VRTGSASSRRVNGFAALAGAVHPSSPKRSAVAKAHLVCLWFGAIGLVSIRFIDDPRLLLVR